MDDKWATAEKYLNMLIAEYAILEFSGAYGLQITLLPLKRRYDKGERTEELYEAIMSCE